MTERYHNQPSNVAPDIRYINALTDHIRLDDVWPTDGGIAT
jgi:hypothetical protein